MKKLILVACVICAGLCGCGGGGQPTEKSSKRAGDRAAGNVKSTVEPICRISSHNRTLRETMCNMIQTR